MTVAEETKILAPGWSPEPRAPFEVGEWVDFTAMEKASNGKNVFFHEIAQIVEIRGLVVIAEIAGSSNVFAPRLSDGTYVKCTHPSEWMSVPDFVPNDDEYPAKIYRGRYSKQMAERRVQIEAEAKAESIREAQKSKLRRILEFTWKTLRNS